MSLTLVTGAAGFIGYHLARAMLARGDEVVGLDNLNAYYDVHLKEARLALLRDQPGFSFVKLDLADGAGLGQLFRQHRFERVVNLAAQAGVRYSLTNPQVYVNSNVVGFLNLLEACRHAEIRHLVFASSSSVYGANTKVPFSVRDNVDHPISLYAATKKSNELMAHAYAHLYGLPCTGLRFFTVYGPWGRPDMAYFSFTRAIVEGHPIELFNHGRHRRDFTYIDDIVDGVIRVLDHVPGPDPGWRGDQPNPAMSLAPYRLYNLGNQQPVEVMYLVSLLEAALGRTADKVLRPAQPGDMLETMADVDDLEADVHFRAKISIEEGIARFVAWYLDYYHAQN